MRVVHADWFADVPDECAWVAAADTTLRVLAEEEEGPPTAFPCLEMRGRVVARGEGRAVVSCGGLLVSCAVDAQEEGEVRVRFTGGGRA